MDKFQLKGRDENWFYLVSAFIILISIPFVAIYYYKFEFIWSKQAASNICIMIALLSSAPIIFSKKAEELISTDFLVLLLLASWAALSAIWAKVPHKVFKLGTMLDVVVFGYLVARVNFKNENRIKLFLLVSVLTGIFISFYGILQYHINSGFFKMPKDQYGAEDPVTTYGLSNFTVDVLVVILPMCLSLLFADFKKKILTKSARVAGFIGLASIIYYIVISRVRAGYMAIITMSISLGVAIVYLNRDFFHRHRKKIFQSITGTIIALVLFLGFTKPGKTIYLTFLSSFNLRHSSVQIRLHAWKQALNIIKHHPVIGVGLGNYEVYSWAYQDETQEKMTLESNTRVDKTHNEFINTQCDLGIIGSIMFLSFFFILLYRSTRYMKNHVDSDMFWVCLGLTLGVVGELTDAMFTFPFQMPGSLHQFYVSIGVLSALVETPDDLARKFTVKFVGFFSEIIKVGAYVVALVMLILSILWNINFTNSEIYYRLGQMLKKQGRLNDALMFFEKGLKYEPFAERIYYDRAFVLAKFNRIREAAESMKNCLKEVPYFGKARKEYAMFLSDAGEYEKALEQFREAIKTHKYAEGEIRLYMATIYLKKNNPKMALSEILEAMRHGARNSNALNILGNALLAIGKPNLAASIMRQSILISGKKYESVASYAMFLSKVNKPEDALQILKESQEDLGHEARYWYIRGIIAHNARDYKDAQKSVNKILEIKPSMRKRIMNTPELKNYVK